MPDMRDRKAGKPVTTDSCDAGGFGIDRLIALTDDIVRKNPDVDRDNVRLTLILLGADPVTRLRRGLLRGRKRDIHR